MWNKQAEKLFGWSEEEARGRELLSFIIPVRYREAHEQWLKQYMETGEGPVLTKTIEIEALHRNENEFPVEWAIVPIKQNGNCFYCVFIRDISERKRAEEKIRFNANLLNAVGQSVIATNMQGLVIYWNKAAEKIYGWAADEAMGKNIIDLTPAQQSREQAMEIMNELAKGHVWSGEFMVQRKDKTVFPAFVTDSPIYDQQGNLAGIIGVSHDISERKKAEATLKSMEKKISDQKIMEQKNISRAIVVAEEEEKNRIGLELHDNINQILAGTKLHLGLAASKDEKIKALLKYPMELIDMTVEEIRLLSQKQVTPLKDIDLEELIRNLVNTLNANNIHTEFNYALPRDLLQDDLKLNIYRLLQEQVNNIIKHAGAKNVRISIEKEDKVIKLKVTDDGAGFDTNIKRKGIGISNMMNRIQFYNGKLNIKSEPGKGCTINITIPY